MKLTAGQAAKETGKSTPTITRAIKNGKLSAEKTEGGGFLIDPAELFRVFPAVTSNTNETPPTLGHETPNQDSMLQVEVEMLRERLADKDNVIDDLRRRLDDESAERRKLTALLTYQPEAPAASPQQPAQTRKRTWWPFGRAND